MVVPKIQSAHNSEARNIINKAIEVINIQSKTIQDLVAEGQLTPEQYAEFIELINDFAIKGQIGHDELKETLSSTILNSVQKDVYDLLVDRVDNLVASNGDGTKDTEIIDSRTGFLGVTHTNLKKRLDASDAYAFLNNAIEGTSQIPYFNEYGMIESVQHKSGNDIIRTDTFTHDDNLIIEERELFEGSKLSFEYDLLNLVTTVLSQEYEDVLKYDLTTYDGWENKNVENGQLYFDGYRIFKYPHNFENSTSYGLLLTVTENNLAEYLRTINTFTSNYERIVESGITGNVKKVLTTRDSPATESIILGTLSIETGYAKIKDIRLFELKPNSQIAKDFNYLTADELDQKYPKEEI